jgi:hypothetical protein
MKHLLPTILTVTLLAMVGCTGMTPSQQRALSGGAAGAAGGAALGAIAGGSPAVGAGVGGAAGAFIGGFWDDINRTLKSTR